jgi:hypothetical protein
MDLLSDAEAVATSSASIEQKEFDDIRALGVAAWSRHPAAERAAGPQHPRFPNSRPNSPPFRLKKLPGETRSFSLQKKIAHTALYTI